MNSRSKNTLTPSTAARLLPLRQGEKSFGARVLDVVRSIPSGETMTYGEVAEAAGRPGAARAVGNIMSRNYNPDIPCHRVIRSDGKLGQYNRGVDKKAKLLKAEGAIA